MHVCVHIHTHTCIHRHTHTCRLCLLFSVLATGLPHVNSGTTDANANPDSTWASHLISESQFLTCKRGYLPRRMKNLGQCLAWLHSDSRPCARGRPLQSSVRVGENLTWHEVILLLHLGLCSAGLLNPVCTLQFPEDLFKMPRTTSEFLGLGPSSLLQTSPRMLSGTVRAASLHFRPRIPTSRWTGNRLGRINNTNSQDGT